MPNVVVFAHLTAADKAARDLTIAKLNEVAQYSKENEPDALGYYFCTPQDESDEKSLFLVEAYKSQAAFEAHMATDAVKNIIAFFTGNPSLSGAPPVHSMMEESSGFTRSSITDFANPWIFYATIDYKEGKRAEALEYLAHITTETEKNETEALSYHIMKDNNHPEKIGVIEAYTNEAYFNDVHMQSESVKAYAPKFGDKQLAPPAITHLKFEGGFLGR